MTALIKFYCNGPPGKQHNGPIGDLCGETLLTPTDDASMARTVAEDYGWQVDARHGDRCPRCLTGENGE